MQENVVLFQFNEHPTSIEHAASSAHLAQGDEWLQCETLLLSFAAIHMKCCHFWTAVYHIVTTQSMLSVISYKRLLPMEEEQLQQKSSESVFEDKNLMKFHSFLLQEIENKNLTVEGFLFV